MSEEPKPTTRKAQCAECGGMRNCDIHGLKEVVYADEHFSAVTTWYLLECRGCETVFVETVATNSEDYIQQYVPGGNGKSRQSWMRPSGIGLRYPSARSRSGWLTSR